MSEQVCTCQDMFSTCVFLTASFSSLSSCCSASFSVSESHSMLVFFVSWKIRSKITIEQLFYSYYYFCWGKSSSVKTQLFYYWGNIGFLVSLPCVCVCYSTDILLSSCNEYHSRSWADEAIECLCLTGRPVAISVTLQKTPCLIPFNPSHVCV